MRLNIPAEEILRCTPTFDHVSSVERWIDRVKFGLDGTDVSNWVFLHYCNHDGVYKADVIAMFEDIKVEDNWITLWNSAHASVHRQDVLVILDFHTGSLISTVMVGSHSKVDRLTSVVPFV